MPQRYSAIANAIALRLSRLNNIGLVHHYVRNIRDMDADDDNFLALCFDRTNDRIACTFITRESVGDEQRTSFQNERSSFYIWHVYLGLKDSDATELIFQELIDEICDAFRPQDDLDNLVELIEPVQVRVIDHVMLKGSASGDILCHHAECAMRVQEFFNY